MSKTKDPDFARDLLRCGTDGHRLCGQAATWKRNADSSKQVSLGVQANYKWCSYHGSAASSLRGKEPSRAAPRSRDSSLVKALGGVFQSYLKKKKNLNLISGNNWFWTKKIVENQRSFHLRKASKPGSLYSRAPWSAAAPTRPSASLAPSRAFSGAPITNFHHDGRICQLGQWGLTSAELRSCSVTFTDF